MTSNIASSVRTLVDRSSAPSSVSLAYRKWGTRLQNYERLIDRSGILNEKIVPSFVWRAHCRKAGCLSEYFLGIFATMLKGCV